MIYDITPPICESLKVWPGDTGLWREIRSEMKEGAGVTLSTMHATVHLGAHADAPSHYGVDAPSIDKVSLDHYLGPCRVVRVDVPRGSCVTPDDWRRRVPAGGGQGASRSIRAERVLFATGTFPDPSVFNEDFAALSVELIDYLHDGGVRLVGIDTPSVDLFTSADLPVHRRCLDHGMAILEGLMLSGDRGSDQAGRWSVGGPGPVPEGVYELIALPLKLVGFDGSPVRAMLRAMANGECGMLNGEC